MPGFPIPEPRPPLPVRPVSAFHTPRVRRPAIISTVGFGGIAAGIAGILVSLTLLSTAGGLLSISAANASRIKQLAPQALPDSRPEQPVMRYVSVAVEAPGRDGIGGGECDALMTLLQRHVSLSPKQRGQLAVLLRQCGRSIFAGELPMTERALSAVLSDCGAMQTAATEGASAGYLLTRGGRVEVYDSGAVFFPADGSATIRGSAENHLNATGHPRLAPADADALVGLVRETSGGALNAPQADALSKMLQAPDQTLVALNDDPAGATLGIVGAAPQPGGCLLIGFAGGSLLLSPTGEPLLASTPIPGLSTIACVATMLLALIGLGMAIHLIVLSNALLNRNIVTPDRHRRWAVRKFVLSLLSGMILGWMIHGFVSTQPGVGRADWLAALAGIVLTLAGCASAGVMMLLLRRRSARLYFDGVM